MMTVWAGRLTPQARVAVHTRTCKATRVTTQSFKQLACYRDEAQGSFFCYDGLLAHTVAVSVVWVLITQ